jgi:hypothetical protein
VNLTPLLATPLAFTTTLPVVAPVGTAVTIDVAPQLVMVVATFPLNVTAPLPCVDPRFVPVIVTAVPTGPEVFDRLVILGAGTTVKVTPLLTTPPTVTTTFPVVAPLGTFTFIVPAAQLATLVAAVPLNVTVLEPWGEPKPVPVIVTEAPTAPDDTESTVMLGGAVRVNVDPLLATPLTVTTTGPLVAPLGTVTPINPAAQLVGVAETPLNVTVLVSCTVPKLFPFTDTAPPIAPEGGCRLVIMGATVKLTALLGVPLTITTTLPVVAPAGTGATMEPDAQLVGVAAPRLNITLLPP